MSDCPTLEQSLAEFAVTEALTRFSGSREKYCFWLARFVAEIAAFETGTAELLAAGQLDAAHRAVHGLKGRSASLGIVRVHFAAQQLDTALLAGDPWHDAWETLHSEIARACATLKPCLARQGSDDIKVI